MKKKLTEKVVKPILKELENYIKVNNEQIADIKETLKGVISPELRKNGEVLIERLEEHNKESEKLIKEGKSFL